MLTAKVWERYGQLRIYVSVGDHELGWFDPRSGRVQVNDPAMEAEFWAAVRAEYERLVSEGRLSAAALPPGPPGTSTAPISQAVPGEPPAAGRCLVRRRLRGGNPADRPSWANWSAGRRSCGCGSRGCGAAC